MSQSIDRREIFFSSLLLLGFEPRHMEELHSIPFNKDIFSLPNKKAFEIVIHFLFERMNPAMAQDRFRDCWPIYSKKHEQAFRKTILNWLVDISKEDADANLPRIVPSLLLSPGGDKIYSVLFYFTQYVVMKVMKSEYGVKESELLLRPKLTPHTKQFSHVMAQSIQASTIRHQQRFLRNIQELVLLQREWKEYSNEIVKEYRSLSKEIRELEHHIKEEEQRLVEAWQGKENSATPRRSHTTGLTEGEWDAMAVKMAQKVNKARELWKSLETFHTDQAHEQAVMDSFLSQNASKHRLDAADLSVQVPELLVRECEEEIQRKHITSIYQKGELDLLQLVKLWTVALRLYLEKLNESPLPKFDAMLPFVTMQVHTHNAYLRNTRAIRSSLAEEVLPDLNSSVSRLVKSLHTETGDTPSKCLQEHIQDAELRLLPPTPDMTFDPSATPKDSLTPMGKTTELFINSPYREDTPKAVSILRETINRSVMRRAGLEQGTPTSALHELRKQTIKKSAIPKASGNSHTPLDRHRNRSAPAQIKSAMEQTPVSSRPRVKKVKTSVKKPPLPRGVKKKTMVEQERNMNGDKEVEMFVHLGTEKDQQPLEAGSTQVKSPSTVKAHDVLIDQIVEAVCGSSDGSAQSSSSSPSPTPGETSDDATTQNLALHDPVAALHSDAFVSRDKLQRTPESPLSSGHVTRPNNTNNSKLTEKEHSPHIPQEDDPIRQSLVTTETEGNRKVTFEVSKPTRRSIISSTISDTYLEESPMPEEIDHVSPLEEVFGMEVKSSNITETELSKQYEELLAHISPADTPSVTPQITYKTRIKESSSLTPSATPHLPRRSQNSFRREILTPDFTPKLPASNRSSHEKSTERSSRKDANILKLSPNSEDIFPTGEFDTSSEGLNFSKTETNLDRHLSGNVSHQFSPRNTEKNFSTVELDHESEIHLSNSSWASPFPRGMSDRLNGTPQLPFYAGKLYRHPEDSPDFTPELPAHLKNRLLHDMKSNSFELTPNLQMRLTLESPKLVSEFTSLTPNGTPRLSKTFQNGAGRTSETPDFTPQLPITRKTQQAYDLNSQREDFDQTQSLAALGISNTESCRGSQRAVLSFEDFDEDESILVNISPM